MTWEEDAACRETDPDLFFPEEGAPNPGVVRICEGCPVRVECLEFALREDIKYGLWGGLSWAERKRLKR